MYFGDVPETIENAGIDGHFGKMFPISYSMCLTKTWCNRKAVYIDRFPCKHFNVKQMGTGLH